MKVGDLIKNRRGNMGIITKRSRLNNKHWWILWLCGDSCTTHERWLEVVC